MKMKSFILTFLIAVVLVHFGQCDDFPNEISDGGIVNHLVEVEDSIFAFKDDIHTRTKRDAETITDSDKAANITTDIIRNYTRYSGPCCKIEVNPDKKFKIDRDLVMECYNQSIGKHNFSSYNISREKDGNSSEYKALVKLWRNEVSCYLNCLALKYHLVNDDGCVQLENVVKHMSDVYDGTWIGNITSSIATNCYKETEQGCADYLKNKPENTCNPTFRKYNWCIYKEIQNNCPKDKIKNEERCKRFKERKDNED
ncbi:hypothetical protein RI129_004079 [Pyrocoelia pectoralis]|uniref:Uncharacterized protein n=1 Tax=Pyrocoelia pectoralis TaxID=417401 RepID=A0AAN7VC70_9COLE